MKIIYKCEVCGFQSESREKVERCESQGRPFTKFLPGDKVEFLRKGLTHELIWAKGIILSIDFMRNHSYTYTIQTDHEEKLISGNLQLYELDSYIKTKEIADSVSIETFISEKDIRPRSVQITIKSSLNI